MSSSSAPRGRGDEATTTHAIGARADAPQGGAREPAAPGVDARRPLRAAMPPLVTVACALALGAVAALDAGTGPDVDLTLLYIAPIGVATVVAGPGPGLALALLATVAGVESARFAGPHLSAGVTAWNAAQRLGVFALVALVLDAFRRRLLRERSAARTDPVTGLGNRLAFEEAARHELARVRRHGRPLSLLYLDCDDFKRVNDRLGHMAGDGMLTAAAAALAGEVRDIDTVARLGGDEFVVLLPEVDREGAVALAIRLRNRLARDLAPRWGGVTFSVGVASFLEPPASVDEMLARADGLMYEAKRSGKDCWRAGAWGGESAR